MEIQLSLQENKLTKKVKVIIPCAGEGTRIKDLSHDIPKSLIKIASLDNIPIIDHLIISLGKFGIQKIIIIKGHLGYQLEGHIKSLIKGNVSLRKKLILIDSGLEYKKGPLYSFLSIVKNDEVFRKNNLYFLFPCDTVFEIRLIKEIFNISAQNLKKIKKFPTLFYKEIDKTFINQKYQDPSRTSLKSFSIIKNIKKGRDHLLKKIIKTESQKISNYSIKLMIPVLILNYHSVKKIVEISTLLPIKTISEALNFMIERRNKILTYSVNPDFEFYDIDDKFDLMMLNKKKKVDNSSFE
jgi:NDP-sugar pyrophosphorylase family protein